MSSPRNPSFAAIAAELEAHLPLLQNAPRLAVYGYIHGVVRRLAPIDAFAVTLHSPDDGGVFTAYSVESGPITVPVRSTGPHEAAERALSSGGLLKCRAEDGPGFIPGGARISWHFPMREYAAKDARIAGVLSVCSSDRDRYEDDESAALQWLADRLALHLWIERQRQGAGAGGSTDGAQCQPSWSEMLAVTASCVASVEEIRSLVDAMAAAVPAECPRLRDDVARLRHRCRSAATRIAEMPMHLYEPATSVSEAAARVSSLSGREREILGLMESGKSNAEIAESLFVTQSTIKFHSRNILRKLGATSRRQAVIVFRSSLSR